MKNAYLIGEKVYLRPLERSDAAVLAGWFNDPEVNRTLLSYRPMSAAAEEEFITKVQASEADLVVAIVLREGDRHIGVTGLHRIDWRSRHASFGICIGEKSEWDKGCGTEAARLIVGHAFRTLNLNRVWLHVDEFNPRAVKAYERVGFRREGVLRQEMFRDGRYWDTFVMGILREEWNALPGN